MWATGTVSCPGVSSRQQEKERRRQARLEAERQAQAQEARAQRLKIAGGAAVLLVAVVAVVVAVLAGGGGKNSTSPKSKNNAGGVSIPAPKTTDLDAAVKAAGCTLKSYPSGYEDRGHVSTSTKVHYKTNPPAFGKHFEVPAQDGDYAGVATPASGHWVHALEHGRIEYQYSPRLPQRDVKGLEALFNEDANLVLVMKNNTGMPYEVAAVAWTHILGCNSFNPRVYDAFRAFRDKYRLKAPEKIATPE